MGSSQTTRGRLHQSSQRSKPTLLVIAHVELALSRSQLTLHSISHETIRFAFLEAYIEKQEGPVAVQIWTSFLNFAKEFINTPAPHKYRLFPTLRCLTALAEKISQTSALEDRRMRRDLVENFVKLVDATVQLSGRSGAGLLRPSEANLRAANKEDATAPTTPLEGLGEGKDILQASIMSEKSVAAPAKTADSAKEVSRVGRYKSDRCDCIADAFVSWLSSLFSLQGELCRTSGGSTSITTSSLLLAEISCITMYHPRSRLERGKLFLQASQ